MENVNIQQQEPQEQKRKRAISKNHNRGAIFRKFIIETFLSNNLEKSCVEDVEEKEKSEASATASSSSSSLNNNNNNNKSSQNEFILDVAGGTGELAVPLALAGFNTTVVDPRQCDFQKNHVMKNLAYHVDQAKNHGNKTKTYLALETRIGAENLEKRGLPLPKQLNELFLFSPEKEAVCSKSCVKMMNMKEKATTTSSEKVEEQQELDVEVSGRNVESEELILAKKQATLIVGLHPDQATEHIVDFALHSNIPFAVIPCCVFAKENPNRRLRSSGKPVKSYEEFIEYLCEKDPGAEGIEVTQLDFDGRNIVVFKR